MKDIKKLHEENSRTALDAYAAGSNQAGKFPQVLAALLATLGAFSAGTCLSWSSPALPLLFQGHVKISADGVSWVASLVTLGAAAGAIPAGLFANLLGRKRLLQILAVPMLASWLLIAYSGCVYGLCIARFLAGFVIGAFSVAIPMYVAELAESSIRGTLGTLFQLQITVGLLFEYLIGMTENWEIMSLVPAAIPVLFLGAFSFMPESPVYLSSRKRMEEARKSLQWFRGEEYDIEDEVKKIEDQLEEAERNQGNIFDLVRSRAPCRALVIALGLMIFQQLSGINAVIFYTQSIFKDSGSSLPPYAPALIVGVVMVIATYLSTILIDRAGRRILLLLSSSVMAICLAVLFLYFHLQEKHSYKLPFTVPLLSIAIYISVFSLGFGPIPWMMLGELFSPKMKGTASSISAAFNWILAFAVTKLFTNLVQAFGSGPTFAMFAVVCVLGFLFVFFIVPETKGKDMEEIQQMLGGTEKCAFTQYEACDDVVIIDIKKTNQ